MTLPKHSTPKKQVDIGILDFSKAFDRVLHARLAKKLDFCGINGKTLSWIQSFLNNRQQNVVINGMCSSSCVVSSGVPQGSVLSPTLSYCTSMIYLKVL